MIVAAISLVLAGLSLAAAIMLLPFLLKMFLYGVVTIFLAACFVLRHALQAVPWIISAGGAMAFTFYALGQQFFTGDDARLTIERRLPPRVRQRTLSLLAIELMLELRKFMAAR